MRFSFLNSLSAKLLALTIAFVMIAEVLIFVPSVAKFRYDWLMRRCLTAQVASLAAEAVPSHTLPKALHEELLKSAGVRSVVLKRNDKRVLVLRESMPPTIKAHYDLRNASYLELIGDAILILFDTTNKPIRVIGEPRFGAGNIIEIVIYDGPLRQDMLRHGLNILALSIIISMFTAALVYFSLNRLFVKPMRRMTRNMVRFREAPEDPLKIMHQTGRNDELGTAERELSVMQQRLAEALKEKSHLAALGLAVSKISHDLRNMLSAAQLISDRFERIEDPTVKRFTPKLISSLDRAIRLCSETLRYGSVQEPEPARKVFPLEPLVKEVGDGLGLPRPGRIDWQIDIDNQLQADADPQQLYRILFNLCRNSVEVLEASKKANQNTIGKLAVSAGRENGVLEMTVADNGPGLPQQALTNLFQPFQGSVRKGGTGLGLAISAELVRAHGGHIEHVASKSGALFKITIPDRDHS